MVNFGPLAAEIVSLVWGTSGNFNGFCVLAALLHGTLVVGVSQTAALNRGCHLYSTGWINSCSFNTVNRLNEQWLFVQHGCTTGCINRLYRVNGVWRAQVVLFAHILHSILSHTNWYSVAVKQGKITVPQFTGYSHKIPEPSWPLRSHCVEQRSIPSPPPNPTLVEQVMYFRPCSTSWLWMCE